jgi:hypothetical protein
MACSSDDDSSPDQRAQALAQDLELQAADFDCIKAWPKVREFRITNKLDRLAETLAVANAPGNGDYPVGTVVQLIPNEAMVKRAAGFSALSNDWEFFSLEVSANGTAITARGVTDVAGPGGNCLNCHAKAERRWDFLCEHEHGCDTIPVSDEFLLSLQDGDARCPAP